MWQVVLDFLLYVGKIVLLTLGTVTVCGFSVHLCAVAFSHLTGARSGKVFDLTAYVGTPIHELGHAIMCPLFGHRITKLCLLSPSAENGVYGYVEHSYNRKNLWSKLGNLFIGIGPIFSGLGIVVLMLWLCFPTQWKSYLALSRALIEEGADLSAVMGNVLALFRALPAAFVENWLRATVGLFVILCVALHISLSWADIRSSLSALPFYLLLLSIFALITFSVDGTATVVATLQLLNLRILSLFCIVISFAAVWVLLALLIRMVQTVIRWF